MKISVSRTGPAGTSTWLSLPGATPLTLKNELEGRGLISAWRGDGPSSSKFVQADIAWVAIDLAVLPLQMVLEDDLTNNFATIEAHNDGLLILGFALSEAVTNEKAYRELLAGLEVKFAGARHHQNALAAYGGANLQAAVLGGALSIDAEKELRALGKEEAQRRKPGFDGAYLRSRVNIGISSIVVASDGRSGVLQQMPQDLEVFCPVHLGKSATAHVHWFADGSPGVRCTHCGRTYASPRTNREYDFDRVDSVLRGLAASGKEEVRLKDVLVVEDQPVQYLRSEFLPELDVKNGFTFIKSPKGSGKSEFMSRLVRDLRKNHATVLAITHRRSLALMLATRLGMTAYFEMDDLAEGTEAGSPPRFRKVPPKKAYAISLDSLPLLVPGDHHYDTVIIDESEQVFSHLIGSTLRENRMEVLHLLRYYLRMARQVIFLDADLGMVSLTAAWKLAEGRNSSGRSEDVRVYVNEWKATNRDVLMFASEAQLTSELIRRVKAGEKTYVATNFRSKAERLEKILRDRCPDKRIYTVSSKTSQTCETQTILRNVTTELSKNIDVLIGTPSIGTGLDISFTDAHGKPERVVENVFGFFGSNVVGHTDIDQQLMRVRNPARVMVWIDPTPFNYEVDVGAVQRELEFSVKRTHAILGYSDSGKPLFADDGGLIEIWAAITAAHRGSLNALHPLFRKLKKDLGWGLIDVEPDEGDSSAGKEALQTAKALLIAEREQRLLHADRLEPDDANDLAKRDKAGELSEEEQFQLERYRIERFYDAELDPELLALDAEGRSRREIRELESLLSYREWVEELDDGQRGSHPIDRRHHLLKRGALSSLFGAAGLFDPQANAFLTDALADKDSLGDFLSMFEGLKGQVESLFKVAPSADRLRNPVGQLRALLKLVGLSLEEAEVVQAHGKKVRRYRIAAERLRWLSEVIQERDVRYKRATAKRQVQEDSPRLLSLKEYLATERSVSSA